MSGLGGEVESEFYWVVFDVDGLCVGCWIGVDGYVLSYLDLVFCGDCVVVIWFDECDGNCEVYFWVGVVEDFFVVLGFCMMDLYVRLKCVMEIEGEFIGVYFVWNDFEFGVVWCDD